MPVAINRRDDLYHVFRFSVQVIAPPEIADMFPQGFFRRIRAPEYSIDETTFREGTALFTRKEPGIPRVNNISLERGIVKSDTGFYKWMLGTLSSGGYKATLAIRMYHRDAWIKADNPGGFAYLMDESAKPHILMTLYNAWPVRYLVSSDLDAGTGDIAISELEVVYEYFDITNNE